MNIVSVKYYQHLAQRTSRYDDCEVKEVSAKLMNGVVGLCGEAGEVADLVKKHYFQGHDLSVEKVVDELGDVCWYIAEICAALGVPMEDVLTKNIEKLKKRYPEGFDVDKSVNREEYKHDAGRDTGTSDGVQGE